MFIENAFLQSSDISRDLFIKHPPEAHDEGTVWLLRKSCMKVFRLRTEFRLSET